jgi:hypothetical protein
MDRLGPDYNLQEVAVSRRGLEAVDLYWDLGSIVCIFRHMLQSLLAVGHIVHAGDSLNLLC